MKNKAVKRIRNRGVSETDAEKRLFKTLKKMGLMSNKDSIYKGVLAFRLENTKYAIRYINNNDELLARCRKAGKEGIEEECFQYAREHNDEFGNRFILELYDVFWEKVWYGVKTR